MTFDPNQPRGHAKNSGSWSAYENGMPEAAMSDAAIEASKVDQREKIAREGFAIADATSVPTAGDLFREGSRVIITKADDDEYIAEAEFNDVDVVKMLCETKGLDSNADWIETANWLNERNDSYEAFLAERGILSDSDVNWDARTFIVAEYLRDQSQVTFAEAGSTLRGSERANWLADSLSDDGEADFAAELFQYISTRKAG